jgi:hypothetical protein
MKMLALMKPKNPVTISIIASVLKRPYAGQKRQARPHSQKDFGPPVKIAIRLMIWSNTAVRRKAHCRGFVATAARNQGRHTAILG